jgi:hypothetical protein
MSSTFPLLDSKILDVNVSEAFGGASGIDQFNGRFIIFVQDGRLLLSKSELMKDEMEVFCNFSGCNSGDELCLSGAGGCDGLSFGMI